MIKRRLGGTLRHNVNHVVNDLSELLKHLDELHGVANSTNLYNRLDGIPFNSNVPDFIGAILSLKTLGLSMGVTFTPNEIFRKLFKSLPPQLYYHWLQEYEYQFSHAVATEDQLKVALNKLNVHYQLHLRMDPPATAPANKVLNVATKPKSRYSGPPCTWCVKWQRKTDHAQDKCWHGDYPGLFGLRNSKRNGSGDRSGPVQHYDAVYDTGATPLSFFKDPPADLVRAPGQVHTAGQDQTPIETVGQGKVRFGDLEIDAIYSPNLAHNLVSGIDIMKKGYKQVIAEGKLSVIDHNNRVVATGSYTPATGLIHMDNKTPSPQGPMDDKQAPEPQILQTTIKKDWHRILGHAHHDMINKTLQRCQLSTVSAPQVACRPCLEGKTRAANIPLVGRQADTLLEIIESDIQGPFPVAGYDGSRYNVKFVDSKSGWIHMRTITNRRSETILAVFKLFQQRMENYLDRKIRIVRTDGGREYEGCFFDYLHNRGIVKQTAIPYAHHQPGKAERSHQTILRLGRAMHIDSQLPMEYYIDAQLTAVYLSNRMIHGRDTKSPYEHIFARAPKLTHLEPFGSICYAYVAPEQRHKLAPTRVRCRLLGYGDNFDVEEVKGYKLLRESDRHIFYSNDVAFSHEPIIPLPNTIRTPPATLSQFYETSPRTDTADVVDAPQDRISEARRETMDDNVSESIDTQNDEARRESDTTENDDGNQSDYFDPETSSVYSENETSNVDTETLPSNNTSETPIVESPLTPPEENNTVGRTEGNNAVLPAENNQPRRSTRLAEQRSRNHIASENEYDVEYRNQVNLVVQQSAHTAKQKKWLTKRLNKDFDQVVNTHVKVLLTQGIEPDIAIPKTYQAAKQSPQWKHWKAAMDKEMKAHDDNSTWTLDELPANTKEVKGKWVYTIKCDEFGNLTRYKARWVAKGFTQIEGIDFTDTFAPVINFKSLRTLMAISSWNRWTVYQDDVPTAFLKGKIKEDVWTQQPTGYEVPGKSCHLNKTLYGLKQSPREWNLTLCEFLTRNGFTQLRKEPCLFINKETKVIVGVYVDDILTTGPNKEVIDEFRQALYKEYNMTKDNGGLLKWYLGIHFKTNEQGGYTLSQQTYVEKKLEAFKDILSAGYNPSPLPDRYESILKKNDGPSNPNFPYRQLVGSLMYLMVCTRPDLAFAVSVVSRALSNPTKGHCLLVNHIWNYLRMNPDISLNYYPQPQPGSQLILEGYVDAAYNNQDHARSTTGYAFLLGGSIICWLSKRQSIVAQSSSEAEYYAAVSAANETMWLKQLLGELGYPQGTITLHEDNTACIALSKNPQESGRTKHIQLKYYVLKDYVQQQEVILKYCPTNSQIGDIFTKQMNGPKLRSHLLTLKCKSTNSGGNQKGIDRPLVNERPLR